MLDVPKTTFNSKTLRFNVITDVKINLYRARSAIGNVFNYNADVTQGISMVLEFDPDPVPYTRGDLS